MWAAATILALIALSATVVHFKRRLAEMATSLRRCRAMHEDLLESQRLKEASLLAQQTALFNSMVEGFLLLDASGRVVTHNRSLVEMFDITGDIRGQSMMEAFRMHELLAVAERVRKESQVTGIELNLHGMGDRCLGVNAASVMAGNGDPGGSIFIFHDLTRLKQLEETRREFVANVSHELRTPLTLIKGYVETLIDGAKNDPVVANRFLHTIQKHTDRLTFLIEDLLTISRLESGAVTLNCHQIFLKPIVERVFDDLQVKAEERKTSLGNRISPQIAAFADGDRLQQVVFNLVDNAIKYGREGGKVSVSAEPKDGTILIRVQDDGPGIPAESRERVFERFFRVDRARSREQGGTGLGLSIVKHIVQSHRGQVWVEGEMGKGSSFCFTLPSEPASLPDASHESDSSTKAYGAAPSDEGEDGEDHATSRVEAPPPKP